jgi:RNA polymerase sigma factor (TIGR02999 family)
MEAIYPELRRLAASKMKGERSDHTWQPTALVNELYLELLRSKDLDRGEERRNEKNAFFGLAAHMMWRLLVRHARPLYRRVEKVAIDDSSHDGELGVAGLDRVDTLLASLAAVDPQLRTIVEMKVFEGLSVDEIAAQLGCSARTVKRRWHLAKHWLADELSGEARGPGA